MKNKYLIIFVLGVAAIAVMYLLYPREKVFGTLDAFAQCLAEKNITMYGAEWCDFCKSEIKAFGGSFRFVPYVECPDEPRRCLALGVSGYPTWIFQDGRKLAGRQGLEKLSRESGCALPNF